MRLSSFGYGLFVGQNRTEAIQALLPRGSEISDPSLDVAERIELDAAHPAPPLFLGTDDAVGFEDLHVLKHGSEGHVQRGRQLADSRFGSAQTLDDAPPAWIRNCIENIAESSGRRRHDMKVRPVDQKVKRMLN